jgi:hypothetical protein
MNLTELKTILEATGYPVAYYHFLESENNPLPTPPFIVYLVTNSDHFTADDSIYMPINDVQIELYTDYKDLDAEKRLEDVLNANDIPYATSEIFIDSEQMFQKIYEVRLL